MMDARGWWEKKIEMFNGYKLSVMQDEKVLESFCKTMCI